MMLLLPSLAFCSRTVGNLNYNNNINNHYDRRSRVESSSSSSHQKISSSLSFVSRRPLISSLLPWNQIWNHVRGGAGDDGNDDGNGETNNNNVSLQDILGQVSPDPHCEFPPSWNEEEEEDENGEMMMKGIVIVDSFCDYHGGYLAKMAKEVYGVCVIQALSTYVTGYMIQQQQQGGGDDDVQDIASSRLPLTEKEVFGWKQNLPQRLNICGIICESDSGLDDAEIFGELLSLSQHDGYNPARRNKFLMNQQIAAAGLASVQQKMCATEEEAITFAKQQLFIHHHHHDQPNQTKSKTNNNNNHNNNDTHQDNIQDESNDINDIDDDDDDANFGVLGSASNVDISSSSMEKNSSTKKRYCVVKPCRGVASDGVYLCSSVEEVRTAFREIQGSSVFGSYDGKKHDEVLIQEFAQGTEYAIDIVSKNGHHKIAALWRYDKRPVNDAPFVYHATELVDAANTSIGHAIYQYMNKVLHVLNIRWGISHCEVIVRSSNNNNNNKDIHDIVLVEVNCRQHATDFAPLTTACIGYNALDMVLAAYLGDDTNSHHRQGALNWDDLPDLPTTRWYGAIVHLVSHVQGIVHAFNVPALEEIEGMESVLAMEIYPQIGNPVEKTVDIRSDAGWLHMMNPNRETFTNDYQRVVQLMPHLFSTIPEEEEEEEEEENKN